MIKILAACGAGVKSSPNLCVKYFFPGTSCAGDANASMSVHYHS